MSVLTCLLFSSILYISLADPVPDTPAPASDYHGEMEVFLAKMDQAIEYHFNIILSKIDQADQEYWVKTISEAMRGYINFMMTLVNQQMNPKSRFEDRDFIIRLNKPGPKGNE